MSGALVASWGDVFAADATEACSIDILVASAARKGALSTTATLALAILAHGVLVQVSGLYDSIEHPLLL